MTTEQIKAAIKEYLDNDKPDKPFWPKDRKIYRPLENPIPLPRPRPK